MEATGVIGLNIPQTVFTVFYAINWGLIANVQPRWKAFDWPRIQTGRTFRRVMLSVVFFNLFGIVIFVFVLWLLHHPVWYLAQKWGWREMMLVGTSVLPAFAVFGLRRTWLAIIELATDSFYWRLSDQQCFVPHQGGTKERDCVDLVWDDSERRCGGVVNLLVGFLYIAVGVGVSGWVTFCGT